MSDTTATESTYKAFSGRSSNVTLKNVTKVFTSYDTKKEVVAVNNVNLEVAEGEMVTLLGPSGCGKTTTLRMIAGFEDPSSGEIFIGGIPMTTVPPNKRGISLVFQSYALFPHLDIWENIAYGLRVQKLPKAEIAQRTQKAVELMQLQGMEHRFPAQVSGGQQQRIALARAIVIEPRVLLFDEPLSNLDAKLREKMRDELRALQKRLGITSLYVTHDQSEAMAISDRVVIMKDGSIMQVGTPREIYEKPANRFVANFIGKANFIPCDVVGYDGQEAMVAIYGKTLRLPKPGDNRPAVGSKATLCVRPEAIRLSKDETLLGGKVTRATYYGSHVEYEVQLDDLSIITEQNEAKESELFHVGESAWFTFKPELIRLLS
ncbi:MAG TPA: ABC transporter ATP-binding protein [Spirochaetales bacterium]|nr:ABC transporter ATP-binding protein [Spirochaetales bacterium]